MAKPEKKTSSFNIPIYLREKLELEANQVNRSMSAQLSMILENYFNSRNPQSNKAKTEADRVKFLA